MGAIVRSSLRDQVLDVLRERLVSGELEPGEIYSAQALSAELGVSGSPVREAMLTLVDRHLMEPVRNRGFRVLPVSDQARQNNFEVRLWIEVPAMRKLAGLRPEFDDSVFRQLAMETVDKAKAGDIIGFLDADRKFHLGLTDLLGDLHLTSIVSDLREHTRLYGLKDLRLAGNLADSAVEHVALLDAIIAGNADLAGKIMNQHLHHVVGEWAGASAPAKSKKDSNRRRAG